MKLSGEISKAVESRDVRDRLVAEGIEFAPSSPQIFAAYIKQEIVKWAKVVQFAGMKLD